MNLSNFFKGKYFIMVKEIAVADFRLRDQGTFLGFLWTLLYPLIYFFVLYGIFKAWMRQIPDFPLYLIIGIVHWGFFVAGTTNSITCLMRYESYIQNINFPKAILVLSSVLSQVFIYLLELIVLIIFWLLVKQKINFTIVAVLPIVLLLIYLIISFSFVLATLGVYFLDIQRIWGLVGSLGLFLTPIFYSLDMLSPTKRRIILLNPMTHIIQAFRTILMDNRLPELSGLGYVFLLSSIILFLGYIFFKKCEKYLVEKI